MRRTYATATWAALPNPCFLKRAANQWTTFFAWGTTGIKLSSLPTKENTATTAPVQPQTATPPEQVQVPQLPQTDTPPEQSAGS